MKTKDIVIIVLALAILLFGYDSIRYRESNNFLNTELNILKDQNSTFEIEIRRLGEEIKEYDDNVSMLLDERKTLIDSYDSIIDNIEDYEKNNMYRINADIDIDSLRGFLANYKY